MPATGSAAFAASTEKVRSAASSSLTADLWVRRLGRGGGGEEQERQENCTEHDGLPFAARASRTLSHVRLHRSTGYRHSFDQWTGGGLGNFADGRDHQSPAPHLAANKGSGKPIMAIDSQGLASRTEAGEKGPMARFWVNYGSHRYAILFFTLLFTLAASPLASALGWSVTAMEILLGVSLIAAVMPHASGRTRIIFLGGLPVAAGCPGGGDGNPSAMRCPTRPLACGP